MTVDVMNLRLIREEIFKRRFQMIADESELTPQKPLNSDSRQRLVKFSDDKVIIFISF